MVCDYSGMQVFDAREKIRVVLGSNPPRGIRGSLRLEGFMESADGVWDAPSNPKNIMSAQVIGNIFFPAK